MLIKEVIQRVQSAYSKGVESDDTRLSRRHIYSKIKSVRAKLLTQALNKKQKISQWNYQTIPCVELIQAKPYECPCLPPLGCTILRTKEQLPEPLTNYDSHFIDSVTSLDGMITYSEVEWEQKRYKKAEKYTSNTPDFYVRNKYLYITHKNGPRILAITGLFEDPVQAIKFPSYCDKGCTENCTDCIPTYDYEFPIDEDMVDTLVEMAVNELITYPSQSREDLTNNSRDSITEQSK